MCQNGIRAKEIEADIAEQVFFIKDNMNLKQRMYFLNQHLKIYLFTLFQKPVIEILRKRMVVINIEYV